MLKSSIRVAAILLAVAAVSAQQPTVVRTVLISHDLSNVAGFVSNLVNVEIPIGGREGRHTHSGSLLAVVQQGTLTLDYEGKPTMTYKVGDTFFVEPGKIHEGQNKGTVPVKLIATFVYPKDKPMTTQVTTPAK
jgi:quercetin dioxygenase-like cupin family protein